jgi:hypothetical protein
MIEVPTAYPRITCDTSVDRRGLGESCYAASRIVPWVLITAPFRIRKVSRIT